MSVVSCPLCGWRVNAATMHCPECGADIHLGHDEALAELEARRGPQSGPIVVRAAPPRLLTRRRLVLLVALVVIVVAVLAPPLLAGYFGPQAATYVADWRPWRTHIKVQLTNLDSTGWPQHASLGVSYHDPWPGAGLTPGDQFFFVYAHRDSPWLPWTVTSQGTGP